MGKGMDGPGEKVLNSRSFSMILSALRRGEPLLNSPAALMTSRFRQRCFRAAGCSPHPPSCACSDHEKLAAHSKPFSPGPSIPLPHTGPLIMTPFPRPPFPIKKTGHPPFRQTFKSTSASRMIPIASSFLRLRLSPKKRYPARDTRMMVPTLMTG